MKGNLVLRFGCVSDDAFEKPLEKVIDYCCEYKKRQKECPFYRERDGIECFFTSCSGGGCENPKKFVHDAEVLKKMVWETMEKYGKLKKIDVVPNTYALLYKNDEDVFIIIKNYCNGPLEDSGKEWYDCRAWTGCKTPYKNNGSECPFFSWETDLNGYECINKRMQCAGLRCIYDALDEAIKIYKSSSDDEKFDEFILEPYAYEYDPDQFERVIKKRASAGF